MRVREELFEGDVVERGGVGGLQVDGGSDVVVERLAPAIGAETPAISWLEAGEAPLRAGGDEIVALREREVEELFGHGGADDMFAAIVIVGATEAVAEEPCLGAHATAFQGGAKHVQERHQDPCCEEVAVEGAFFEIRQNVPGVIMVRASAGLYREAAS